MLGLQISRHYHKKEILKQKIIQIKRSKIILTFIISNPNLKQIPIKPIQ